MTLGVASNSANAEIYLGGNLNVANIEFANVDDATGYASIFGIRPQGTGFGVELMRHDIGGAIGPSKFSSSGTNASVVFWVKNEAEPVDDYRSCFKLGVARTTTTVWGATDTRSGLSAGFGLEYGMKSHLSMYAGVDSMFVFDANRMLFDVMTQIGFGIRVHF